MVDPQIHIDGLHEFVMVARREIEGMPEEISPVMVIALTISRDENGIATRMDRAEIRRVAWEAAGPKRELITLM